MGNSPDSPSADAPVPGPEPFSRTHTFHPCTPEETAAIGREIAGSLRPGDVVGLRGDLGTGKSVLARAIAGALGVDESMPSPSYTLVEEYTGRYPVLHVDLYRLADEEEFAMLGLDESMEVSVSLIEWIDRAPGIEATAVVAVHLEIDPHNVECRHCSVGWRRRRVGGESKAWPR
jgi:tRNA threonylcarbamoyladenosine biosynthesis protein TsaE